MLVFARESQLSASLYGGYRSVPLRLDVHRLFIPVAGIIQVLGVFELLASSILPLELSIDWRIFILEDFESLERIGFNQLTNPEHIGIIASRQVAPLVIPVVEVLEAEVVSAVPDYTFRRCPKGDFLLLFRDLGEIKVAQSLSQFWCELM